MERAGSRGSVTPHEEPLHEEPLREEPLCEERLLDLLELPVME